MSHTPISSIADGNVRNSGVNIQNTVTFKKKDEVVERGNGLYVAQQLVSLGRG